MVAPRGMSHEQQFVRERQDICFSNGCDDVCDHRSDITFVRTRRHEQIRPSRHVAFPDLGFRDGVFHRLRDSGIKTFPPGIIHMQFHFLTAKQKQPGRLNPSGRKEYNDPNLGTGGNPLYTMPPGYSVLHAISPVVYHGIIEHSAGLSLRHVLYQTNAIAFLMGRGIPFPQALYIVESWEQYERFPYFEDMPV